MSYHVNGAKLRPQECADAECGLPHFATVQEAQVACQAAVQARLATPAVDPQTHDAEVARLQRMLEQTYQACKQHDAVLFSVKDRQYRLPSELEQLEEDLKAFLRGEVDPQARQLAQEFQRLLKETSRLRLALRDLEKHYGNWPRYYSNRGPHLHSDQDCYRLKSRAYPYEFVGRLHPEFSGLLPQKILASSDELCPLCFSVPQRQRLSKRYDYPECAGSRTSDFDPITAITGFRYGNLGVCTHCQRRVSITKTGKLRLHTTAD